MKRLARGRTARKCPRDLAAKVAELVAGSEGVNYGDPAAEAAYYAEAAPIIQAVIECPTDCLPGFRMKAEAAVWSAGGVIVLGPKPTDQERLIDTLLRDLLATPNHCSTCVDA